MGFVGQLGDDLLEIPRDVADGDVLLVSWVWSLAILAVKPSEIA